MAYLTGVQTGNACLGHIIQEQYSSTFRHFQVLGSAVYPVSLREGGGWRLLGNFMAQNNRDGQVRASTWAPILILIRARFSSRCAYMIC
jgi:hypothetical protein